MNAMLAGGVLRVVGTPGADTIDVRVVGGGRTGGGREFVELAGVGRFPASRVRTLSIETGGDADTIDVCLDCRRSRIPALRIDAGDGTDRVDVSQSRAGKGGIRVQGGAGDDTIDVAAAGTPKRVVQLDGGPGIDTINRVREFVAGVTVKAPGGLGEWERQIVALTNEERARVGLPPLRIDGRLAEAARIQADQMAWLDRMAHTLATAPLPTLTDRLRHVGYPVGGGENIAFNYTTPHDVMLGWLYSQNHRENLLRPEYRDIGIGVAYNNEGLPYFAQVFGIGSS